MIVRTSMAMRPIMSQSIKLSVSRSARRSLFTPSAIRSADLVQQLYLKELKDYKPAPLKANDSEGHVQKFSVPKAPATPEEANLSSGLKEYETSQPEIEGAAASGEVVIEDWFEEPEEEVAHH